MIREDPSNAYLVSGERGFLGSVRGDVLLLSKCANVSHKVTVRKTDDCYEGNLFYKMLCVLLLPVIFEDLNGPLI